MPRIALGTWNKSKNKTDKDACPQGACSVVFGTIHTKNKA